MKDYRPSRVNNFDLIRILAASQVVFGHSVSHLKIEGFLFWLQKNVFIFFPGVPIFFFVSGFLISWSFSRSPLEVKSFFYKRLLRIFPGLWICVLLSIILLLVDFQGDVIDLLSAKSFIAWIGMQLSFFQYYTPDILRFWGVGTPNGSLWTISVELQFYLALPLLFLATKKSKWLLIILMGLSIISNYFISIANQDIVIIKLLQVSVLPYLYYFGIGIASFFYYEKIRKYVESKFIYWFAAYVLIIGLSSYFNFNIYSYSVESPMSLVADFVLAFLILSAAYTAPQLSEKFLKGNDISYGVYIYHMLVVNFFVQRGIVGDSWYLAFVYAITVIVAFLSWKLVEKPALKMKKKL